MSKEYEAALKGTREEAANVAEDIRKNLKRYEKHKDVEKYQLQYSVQVLHSICVLAQTPQGIHHDIYCDIIERVLRPHIQPKASAAHWAKYLEFLRYFHYLLECKKLVPEADRIYDCLAGQENKWQNEGDYKQIWSLYCQHLFVQRYRTPAEASEANRQTNSVLEAMAELFSDMLLNNAKLNFSYPELIADFVQSLLSKRAASVLSYLASLPAQPKSKMFDSFFELLAKMTSAQPEPAAISSLCQRHLDALVAFVQLDVVEKERQQVALKYLRACREIRWLQAEQAMGYVFSLLYYYVKLIYTQVENENFSKIYAELCGKFTAFFTKSGETLMAEKKWFRDVPVVLHLVLAQIVPQPNTPFEVFFQQMKGVVCYTAHFELIFACIKLAPRITETKLINFTCCTSVRKHLILGLSLTAIAGYSSFVLNSPDKDNEADQPLLEAMNKSFSSIIHHAINIVNSMACINATSPHLRMLYARIAQLTRDVKTPAQALYSIALAELLVRIQSKFDEHDWVMLLRRLYKTAALALDHKMSAVLHSYYIAALMLEKPFNVSVLRNQIGLYYSSSSSILSMGLDAAHNKCLLEFYECSQSVFKPNLEPQQKCLLHWLETEDAFYYQKNNAALHSSLMRCSPTDYAFVLVVHAAKLPADGLSKLKTLREILRKRKQTDGKLKRLDQLTLAHTCSALLHEQIESKKKVLTFETKDCQEDNLIELMLSKGLQAMSVPNEMRMIELALEALKASEEFFNKADLEHISSDEAYIDWEHLLDELAAIALYFQYSGYTEYATSTWLLHYRIANSIEHSHHLLRSLAYLCENADLLEEDEHSNLTEQVAAQQTTILNYLLRFPDLLRRQQSFVLCCLCQMAYFYARTGKLSYAQILLQLVQHKHKELPDRQGKYDVVLATSESVKFRILWKFSSDIDGKAPQQTAPIMQPCLLREAEMTLGRFRNFTSISATDSITYMILILNLVQQIAECGANRLFDNFLNVFFMSAVKMALQSGSALRLVQILTMWMWSNLQMENVKKAQAKLKIIECIMGVKSFQHLAQPKADEAVSMKNHIKQPVPNFEKMALQLNPGMEIMRKVAQLHVSPEKMDKMRLSPTARSLDLKRFLSYNSSKTPQPNEILEWTYFAVGCLNARLYFLIEDYEQLEDFYQRCTSWLEQKNGSFVSRIFLNIQLINQQYFVNYLRSQKHYDKALLSINSGLDKCIELNRNVDSLYRINLMLQRRVTKAEILLSQQAAEQCSKQSQLRRALEFNISPEDKGTLAKSKVRENLVIKEPSSKHKKAKSTTKTAAGFTIYNSENDNRSKPLSILAKTSRLKPISMVNDTTSDQNDLNMCQAIEISDSDENVADEEAQQSKQSKGAKSATVKSTGSSTISAPTKPQTTSANSQKTKAARSNRKPIEIIDLDDDVEESAKVISKNLHAEDNIVEKMKSLELATAPAIKTKLQRTRKPPAVKNQLSVDLFSSEDSSPLLTITKSKSIPKTLLSKPLTAVGITTPDPEVLLPSTKSRAPKSTKAIVETPLRKANSDVVANGRGRGRPRKVGIEELENMMPAVASSAASRRRQKI